MGALRPRIAIYVPLRSGVSGFRARADYDAQRWPGIAVVKDAIERHGHEVGYCSAATVSDHDIVLVSITSVRDWWPIIAERVTWPKGRYTVIAGGAGLLNIRPVLDCADIFVFGRAEHTIGPLIDATLARETYAHPSICYARDFSPDRAYEIAQVTEAYPYTVTLPSGETWKEGHIGCQRRCLFCSFAWQRKPVYERGALFFHQEFSNADERTIFDLDLSRPATWNEHNRYMILGLDGTSERLRMAINKPITRQMVITFLRGLAFLPNPHRMKFYSIVGYPTETPEDWRELAETIDEADRDLPATNAKWGIELHCTPFRAMPATPLAVWPMAYRSFRDEIARALRTPRAMLEKAGKDNIFYHGQRIWAVQTGTTEGLASAALHVLMLRGDETHAQIVRKLATSKAFWAANTAARCRTLEAHLDIDRLFGWYTWDDLPTRYLHSYVGQQGMARAERVAWAKLTGERPTEKRGQL